MSAMTKNLTDAERAAREQAESEVMPARDSVRLAQPALMTNDAAAKKYWKNILSRMEGYSILDDLDSDTLGIYCVMLSRYDGLCKDLRAARADPEMAERADSINTKLQRLEGSILQYADKLGLTPSGRARLAQKRAEKLAAEFDLDGDLFGD
jgi:P27 family predicted phage terminase small subunit